jgi:hypothetical protein
MGGQSLRASFAETGPFGYPWRKDALNDNEAIGVASPKRRRPNRKPQKTRKYQLLGMEVRVYFVYGIQDADH